MRPSGVREHPNGSAVVYVSVGCHTTEFGDNPSPTSATNNWLSLSSVITDSPPPVADKAIRAPVCCAGDRIVRFQLPVCASNLAICHTFVSNVNNAYSQLFVAVNPANFWNGNKLLDDPSLRLTA